MAPIELVRDLMTVGVPTCAPDTAVVTIAQRLLDEGVEAVVVLDAEGHAVGVVSQDDLIRAYTRDDCRDLTAEAVMTEGVPQVPPDIPLAAAAQIMQDQGVRVLFMMHHAEGITYPAAMLSYTHLLRHLVTPERDALKDLGIRAEREQPLDAFFRRRDEAKRRIDPRDRPGRNTRR